MLKWVVFYAPAVNCICVMNGLSNHETARFHVRNKKLGKEGEK